MKYDAPATQETHASASNPLTRRIDATQPFVYQIRVEGELDSQWTEWFGGMTIAPQENGETLVSGAVIDQAALFGLLKKVRDLGMALVSVNRVNPREPDASEVKSKANHFRAKEDKK